MLYYYFDGPSYRCPSPKCVDSSVYLLLQFPLECDPLHIHQETQTNTLNLAGS